MAVFLVISLEPPIPWFAGAMTTARTPHTAKLLNNLLLRNINVLIAMKPFQTPVFKNETSSAVLCVVKWRCYER